MRKIAIALTALTILAACSSEPAEAPITEETVAAETAVSTTANGSPAGVYEVTGPDGTATTFTVNADGTFIDTDAAGATLAQGTWVVTDGKTCFTANTEGATPVCYTETAPAADGSFTSTSDQGDVSTVRPIAAAPAAPAQ